MKRRGALEFRRSARNTSRSHITGTTVTSGSGAIASDAASTNKATALVVNVAAAVYQTTTVGAHYVIDSTLDGDSSTCAAVVVTIDTTQTEHILVSSSRRFDLSVGSEIHEPLTRHSLYEKT